MIFNQTQNGSPNGESFCVFRAAHSGRLADFLPAGTFDAYANVDK